MIHCTLGRFGCFFFFTSFFTFKNLMRFSSTRFSLETGTLKHLHKLNTTYLSTQLSNGKIQLELLLSNITDDIHSEHSSTSMT